MRSDKLWKIVVELLTSTGDISMCARSWWWTPKSLHAYLLESNVDPCVLQSHVGLALRFLSTNGLAQANRFQTTHFYCLDMESKTIPSGQLGKKSPMPCLISTTMLSKLRCENGSANGSANIQEMEHEPDEPEVGVSSCQQVGQRLDAEGMPLGVRGDAAGRFGVAMVEEQAKLTLPDHYSDKAGNGYQIVDNYIRAGFNLELFNHHRTCTSNMPCTLQCDKVSKSGWACREVYSCSGCGTKFNFNTCKQIKTPVISKGKRFSRQQPVLNVSTPLALKLSGINTYQAEQFFGEASVQMPTRRNIIESFGKVLLAIEDRAKLILCENRQALVKAVRDSPDYVAGEHSILWEDPTNGEMHDTVMITGSLDGTGSTRSYNHRITGTQAAVTAFGRAYSLSLPISYRVDRTACWKCTLAMHRAIRRGDENPSLSVGDHLGECTGNSVHGPAVSEELALEEVGELLLLDENGMYLGDEEALFLSLPVTDGDTKGALRLMTRQMAIIGDVALDKAERSPCCTHVSKNMVGGLYKLKTDDTTMAGKGLLEPGRIKQLRSYVHTHLRRLKAVSWDQDRGPTEDQIDKTFCDINNILPHVCGDHRNCKDESLCSYIQMKNSNPEWKDKVSLTAEEEDELNHQMYRQKKTLQYNLGLNRDGIFKVQREISLRYNKKSLYQLSRMLTCNENEGMWGNLTRHTQGKRLNQNYGPGYEAGLQLVLGKRSQPNTFEADLGHDLGLTDQMPCQVEFRERRTTQKDQGIIRHATEEYKSARRHAKVVKKSMGSNKQVDRTRCYKPEKITSGDKEKVPLSASKVQVKRSRKCANCKCPGHTRTNCDMPSTMEPYAIGEHWTSHAFISY